MSEFLTRLNEEIGAVIQSVLPSTATISGESIDLQGGGSGSGWIFDTNGHLVTNNHVVEGLAGPWQVRFPNGPQRWGTVVGRDPSTDLAVVKVGDPTAPPLTIRTEPAVLGEVCLAIGTPLSLPQSASFGIVSGVSRQSGMEGQERIEELIQTDAAVNPGNSGGPLVDSRGHVLGVNVGSRGGTATVNFAIPAEIVVDIVPELIAFGRVERASIGVTVSTRWVDFEDGTRNMVEVVMVRHDSSPIQPGDVLIRIDATPVTRRLDVRKALNRSKINTDVTVQVLRNGQYLDLLVPATARSK